MNLAKRGYAAAAKVTQEKPRTAITVYVDDLTSERYRDGSYDGIPDLIENIHLQDKQGCKEASRALRKKLKYGNVHNQLRALDVLNACVENGGPRFESTFANERLVDRIKDMATDPYLDPKVHRRLMAILQSWQKVFKGRSDMSLVAGLYASCAGHKRPAVSVLGRDTTGASSQTEDHSEQYNALMRAEKERADLKRQAKQQELDRTAKAKEDKKRAKEDRIQQSQRTTAQPFNFDRERPQIQETIFLSNQASTNLVHSLKLANRETESIHQNVDVQKRLEAVKNLRRPLLRYIRLVQHEEFIGVLIEANELQLEALAIYDSLSKSGIDDSDDETQGAEELRGLSLNDAAGKPGLSRARSSASVKSEIGKLQERQRRRIEEARTQRLQNAHPDLVGLDMDPFGSTAANDLQVPLAPNTNSTSQTSLSNSSEAAHMGSLSDYSDYSSEEDPAQSTADQTHASLRTAGLHGSTEDPFADPFGDNQYATEDVPRTHTRMSWAEV